MKISIVVPLFKGKKYINNIVQMIENNIITLKNSDYGLEVELIFINDFPDEKISEKVESNINIKVINNKKNEGVHFSRVEGVKVAKGEYILFLDQDDTICERYFFSQLSCIKDNDAVICNGLYRNGRIICSTMPKCIVDYCVLWPQLVKSPGQVLIKKEAIPHKWLTDIILESGADDLFLWILMGNSNSRMICNKESLFVHNEDGKNTSFDWLKQKKSLEEVKNKLKSYSDIQNISNWIDKIDFTINKFESYHCLEEKWDAKLTQCREGCIWNKLKGMRIAIYGFGVLGKRLWQELMINNIEIEYVIDQNDTIDNIKHFRPTDKLPNVDYIVVTPIWDYSYIRNNLKKTGVMAHIVSLVEILDGN